MSRFRATRTVRGPDGQRWEIYVTSGLPRGRGPAHVWLLTRAWRRLVELPGELVALARSRVRYVEAIDFGPPRRAWRWRTTPVHVERVVDQVAAGLEAGEVARPVGADFLGEVR